MGRGSCHIILWTAQAQDTETRGPRPWPGSGPRPTLPPRPAGLTPCPPLCGWLCQPGQELPTAPQGRCSRRWPLGGNPLAAPAHHSAPGVAALLLGQRQPLGKVRAPPNARTALPKRQAGTGGGYSLGGVLPTSCAVRAGQAAAEQRPPPRWGRQRTQRQATAPAPRHPTQHTGNDRQRRAVGHAAALGTGAESSRVRAGTCTDRPSNGAYCAVPGGCTARNRITDVMRNCFAIVRYRRITQRLYAIGPTGQAQRKATRYAACGRDGVGPPAGGPVIQQASAPAGARSSSRATGWPRCPCRGFRAAAPAGPGHCAGRALRRSAAPAAVSAP